MRVAITRTRSCTPSQPAFRIPDQFFARQPTGALDEAAFDLTSGYAHVHRIASIVQNVDPADVMHAGEAIDFDFTHRRANREIMERLPAARFAIVVNVRRPVEPGRAQTRALEVGALQNLGERDLILRRIQLENGVLREDDLV